MRIDLLSYLLLKRSGKEPARSGKGPVVLMYHSITPGKARPDSRWAVSEESFLAQLALLKEEGWTTACVRDLLHADNLSPRTVVLTFDDGFADNFDHAFRHLAANGMKATWFVVSRDIGRLAGWQGEEASASQTLNAGQLREMAAAGMEIGSHTRTHARLTEIDINSVREEVSGSERDLVELLGMPVTSFAYPYGLFNEECVEIVRKAGFQVACTTNTGRFGSAPDLWRVCRVGVFSDDTLSTFARKLVFADTEVRWRHVAGSAAGKLLSTVGVRNE
jgi:peptidoglycan/xylan/chitin deacetylase (PgdA/CDA1 family)